jgi:hypothetical protein
MTRACAWLAGVRFSRTLRLSPNSGACVSNFADSCELLRGQRQ